jgi:hypothetical protein
MSKLCTSIAATVLPFPFAIATVYTIIKLFCGIVPTVSTVSTIIRLFCGIVPTVSTVSTIIRLFCGIVPTVW